MRWLIPLFLAVLVAGCATSASKVWPARVGIYSFDQCVVELGPPDKQARLSDGTFVAEWLTRRGGTYTEAGPGFGPYYGRYGHPYYPMITESRMPDYFLRLTFGPDNVLKDWRAFAR